MTEQVLLLEAVGQENFFEWWANDDIRIHIRADTKEEAFDILGKFLLDLKTNKVEFNKQ